MDQLINNGLDLYRVNTFAIIPEEREQDGFHIQLDNIRLRKIAE